MKPGRQKGHQLSGTTDNPPLNYRGHIAGLDMLRGVAVLVVLLDHGYGNATEYTLWHGPERWWIALTGMGHLGVHLFFILSGFLITGILLDGKDRPRRMLTFYGRRLRRIVPAYLVLLAVLKLAHLVDWKFILASLLFVVNMGRLVGAKLYQYSYVWSLAVEEQFYLVWPWVLWRASQKTILRTIVACLVLVPVIRLGMAAAGQDSYFKTWVNVDYLMYGALVAYTLRSGALHAGNLRRVTRWLYLGGGVGILLSIAVWAAANNTVWALLLFVSVGRTPELAIFVAMLLSSILAHQSGPEPAIAAVRRGAAWERVGRHAVLLPGRALVFLGYISYGLYLVHMVVFRLYDRQAAGSRLGNIDHSFSALTLRAVVCSALSILLAWLSRSTLEAWFLRRAGLPASRSKGIAQSLAAAGPRPRE
jgi:peptidoglycan/LPS O-acetylase OafA/YrhL